MSYLVGVWTNVARRRYRRHPLARVFLIVAIAKLTFGERNGKHTA